MTYIRRGNPTKAQHISNIFRRTVTLGCGYGSLNAGSGGGRAIWRYCYQMPSF